VKLLITGGCGFLGSNLAAYALKNKFQVFVFDNLSRHGSSSNLEWLTKQGQFQFTHGDIRTQGDIENIIESIKPDAIFHLAGQVAMTTSVQDPLKDFQINAMGSFYLLNAVRKYSPRSKVIYSSTNKVYGDMEQIEYIEKETRYIPKLFQNGFSEDMQVHFQSPYGCSKGSADQYMLDFYKMFGIKTVVFRHSSMYGGRQYATFDQGWVGWFCQQALEIKQNRTRNPFTIAGSGKQVRDLLHVDDMISLYFKALENIDTMQGQAFNIGGGIENSLSLLELFKELEKMLKIEMRFTKTPQRQSDQKFFVADLVKINNYLDWQPKVIKTEGLASMLEWLGSDE